MSRALVLGGGGVAGIAWETGVLAGLAAEGVDVLSADIVIGTSAGSAVAAQVTSGRSFEELMRRQTDPASQAAELQPTGLSVAELIEFWTRLYEEEPDPAARRKKAGAMALTGSTVPVAARREVIVSRLPVLTWPDRPLSITAVNAESGEPRVFDRTSGVDLVDAVAASCAVPGVWPTVPIDGARYMDGGMRSATNADLAAGHDRVLVLAPLIDPFFEEELATLRRDGRAEAILPDDPSLAAVGPNPLDPATRTPAAYAGLTQGRAAAATVARLWT